MLDGVVVFGAFIIQPETETVVVFHFQFQPYILFQLHFKQAATAIHRTEQSATVSFGNDDLF